ncbi:MAG: ROK family protein [Nitrososphaerales archaeon]
MSLGLGLDVGASWIKALIGDKKKIIARVKRPTYKGPNPTLFVERVLETIFDIPQELLKSISAVGIGTIGPLDIKTGTINPVNVRAKNIPLAKILNATLKMPIYFANDCLAAVIGEWFYGKGKGFDNVVYITISTGIGGGVIVDGRPLLGKDGNAHEIGHIVLEQKSRIRCGCGGHGHWEALASGSGIWNTALEIFKDYKGPFTPLSERLSRKERVSAKDIYEARNKGDALASMIVEKCNGIHAAGIASVINSYDPEVVIIGGSIPINNPYMVDRIKDLVGKYITNRMPEIVLTDFKEDVVMMGGLAIVFEDFWGKDKMLFKG